MVMVPILLGVPWRTVLHPSGAGAVVFLLPPAVFFIFAPPFPSLSRAAFKKRVRWGHSRALAACSPSQFAHLSASELSVWDVSEWGPLHLRHRMFSLQIEIWCPNFQQRVHCGVGGSGA
ncbi:MAG: hypothetical protein NXY57DRAFT_582968 [Lentinula lateritia]|nr:MAG: hypothetical protein NXY57DRAFT_582968 [Lentinula lateritia]